MRQLNTSGIDVKDLQSHQSSLEDIFVRPGQSAMTSRSLNIYAIRAIYRFEMQRWLRTIAQSLLAPVISTSLYFVVFGSAIGSRMTDVGGVSYGAFIVPGLTMLSILTQSISNASFGIYVTKWSGTIYEILSAPISWVETVGRLCRLGPRRSRSCSA